MIVVTGAAGFIGSNIVWALNESGITDIAVCDWLKQDQRWLNLRKRQFRAFVFPEDLLNTLKARAGEIEAVIHMGADSSTTITDGDHAMRVNFQYTLDLVDWCTEARVPIVYASSAATYGGGEQGFDDDGSVAALRRLRPLNLYGWSKHQLDLILAERAELGLPLPPRCIGLKYFNVYGPNEHHKGPMMSVVGKNYATAAAGGTIDLFQSHRDGIAHGEQRRDFVSVDDVVAVTLWALRQGPAFGLFNVGTGQAATFSAFVAALFDACGNAPRINYVPMPEPLRDRYQYLTEAATGRLRQAGCDHVFLDVRQGVARYVDVLHQEDPYR